MMNALTWMFLTARVLHKYMFLFVLFCFAFLIHHKALWFLYLQTDVFLVVAMFSSKRVSISCKCLYIIFHEEIWIESLWLWTVKGGIWCEFLWTNFQIDLDFGKEAVIFEKEIKKTEERKEGRSDLEPFSNYSLPAHYKSSNNLSGLNRPSPKSCYIGERTDKSRYISKTKHFSSAKCRQINNQWEKRKKELEVSLWGTIYLTSPMTSCLSAKM